MQNTPDPFAPGYRLTDGNQLNYQSANPSWSVSNPISATVGGTMATSTPITFTITNVATVASPGAGVTLPQALPGRVFWVINNGANDVRIFAAGQSTVNGAAGTIGVLLPKGRTGIFSAVATQQWILLDVASSASLLNPAGAVATISALRSTVPAANTTIVVDGYYAAGDGGGGIFYAVTSGSYTDNGGTIITTGYGVTASAAWLRVDVSNSDPINVLSWGAYANGTNASTTKTSIQNAINYAQAAAHGGMIYFPQGQYLIDDAITVTSANITLYGDNPGASYIMSNSATNTILTIGNVGTLLNTCSVRSLGFGRTTTGSANSGIYVSNVTNLLVQNVSVEECGQAYYVVNSSSITFQNCRASRTGAGSDTFYGWSVDSSGGLAADRITLVDCSSTIPAGAAYTGTSYGASVQGTLASNCSIKGFSTARHSYGVYIYATSSTQNYDVLIDGNVHDFFKTKAVVLKSIVSATVSNSWFNPAAGASQSVQLDTCRNVTVTANQFFGDANYASHTGLQFTSSTNCVVSNNTFQNNIVGLAGNAASTYNTIIGNSFYNLAGKAGAVQIQFAGQNNVVSGNSMDGTSNRGVQFFSGSSSNIAVGNTANSSSITYPYKNDGINNTVVSNAGQKASVYQNFLPNTQWQIWSRTSSITKVNSAGTGTQTPVAVSSFTTGSNTCVFTTSNTQQLKVGDIGYFGAGDAAITRAPMRVTALTTNTSFTCLLPFQATASVSSAQSFVPITVGDLTGAAGGAGPDRWQRYTTSGTVPKIWKDDFTANNIAGSPYSVGLQKTDNSVQTFYCDVDSPTILKLRGRQVTFGCWVYQKAQGGSGTWNLFINDGAVTQSINGTGVSVAGFQWLEVTATISSSCTSMSCGVQFNGISGDIYYVSQPILTLGAFIGQGNYIQNLNEMLWFDAHVNPPTLTPFSGTFPTTLISGATWYGYELDLEAICYCQIDRTVKSFNVKWEATSATVGLNLFVMSSLPGPNVFGGQVSIQVAGVMNSCSSADSPVDTGTVYGLGYFAISSGTASGANFSNITIDISGARLS